LNQIKSSVGIEGANSKALPAETKALSADKLVKPTGTSLSYASIV